jgi:hypothetical protein
VILPGAAHFFTGFHFRIQCMKTCPAEEKGKRCAGRRPGGITAPKRRASRKRMETGKVTREAGSAPS